MSQDRRPPGRSLEAAVAPEPVDGLKGELADLCRTTARLKDLVVRMGRSSVRAAMIYQLSSPEHQRELADGIDARVRAALATPEKGGGPSGTDLARDAWNGVESPDNRQGPGL